METPSAVPFVAAYRLQFQPAFPFDAATAVVPYLRALGISHVYSSPVFEAVAGSTHGYDVIDPQRVRVEIGGAEGRARLVAALRAAGMGLIADIVPNHLALEGNRWWLDLLEHGPASAFAAFFDLTTAVDAQGPVEGIVIPVLGEPYGQELEAGRITLVVEEGRVLVAYGHQRFPLSPESRAGVPGLGPDASEADRAAAVAALNADARQLHDLLERQHYRLAWWRLARDESPYRRFFDVNALIGIRVDRSEVFDATHELIHAWVREGSVDGLRVDHIDGLADPARYLERLRLLAPRQWIGVEKILATDEPLPDWPVDGTTGYEFGALMMRLFTDPDAEEPLTRLYHQFTGESDELHDVEDDARHEVLGHWLQGDVNRVAVLLHGLCQRDIRLRDYSMRDAVTLVQELVAGTPVYRTYVTAEGPPEADAARLADIFERMHTRCPDLPAPLIDFAAHLMAAPAMVPGAREFVTRLQQLSTAVTAKSIEDTAFYRYNRYIAHNDVGSDPGRFSASPDDFIATVTRWQARNPMTMHGTTTHDSKRSEDVRARLTMLSEDPEAWTRLVETWGARSDAYRIDGQPDRNFEYYLYQTLVGAWPLSRERAKIHAEKAIREAKVFTNWLTPSAEYERAVTHLIDGLYDDRRFISELEEFVAGLHPGDRVKSLAQVLLKITLPGLPDFYQGSELWSLLLCDPDNRGVVDYTSRRALLDECLALDAPAVLARMDEGLPKMWTIAKALALRSRCASLGDSSAPIVPLGVTGPAGSRVVAFRRGDDAAVIVPIRTATTNWQDSRVELPPGPWVNVLSGETIDGGPCDIAALFARFPVALLERQPRQEATS